MKYIDAEKLKAEIERRRLQNRYIDTDGYEQELFEIIDSLPNETPQGLDEAAEKFARSYDSGTCDGIAQDCFKAGANWQMANAIRREIEKED